MTWQKTRDLRDLSLGPLQIVGGLLILRPVTEVENGSISLGRHAITVQQIWGVAFVGALFWLLAPLERRRQARVVALLGAVALPGFVGAVLGPVHGGALREWFWVCVAALALLVARERASSYTLRAVAATFAAATGVVFLIALIKGYGSTGHVLQPNGFVSQLSAGFPSPHTLAFACIGLLPWTLVLALGGDRRGVVIGALFAGGLVAIVVLTTIRTAQLALIPLGVAAVLAVASRTPVGSRTRAVAPSALGLALAIGILVSAAVPSVRARWSGFTSGPESGLQWAGSGRGWLWHQALINYGNSPLVNKVLGSGATASEALTTRRIGTPFAPHSDLLELLVAVGALGCLVLLAFAVFLVVRLVRSRHALREGGLDWLWLIAFGGLGSYAVCSLLTGFMTYTTGAVAGGVLLGSVIGLGELAPARLGELAAAPTLPTRERPWGRATAALASTAVGALALILVVVHITGPTAVPKPPATLVLTMTPANPRDPALERLTVAAGAVPTASSPADAAGLIRLVAHLPSRVGLAGAAAPIGTVIVDSRATGIRGLVASLRGTAGTTWMVFRQRGAKPSFAPVGSYPAAVLGDRPRAYWPLTDADVLARDYSGWGGNGTYSGGVQSGLPGVLGSFDRSTSFDGVSGTVTVHVRGLSRRAGARTTVEAWVRPNATSQGEFVFGFPFYAVYERGRYLGFNTGNNGDLYGAAVPHLTDRWHYIVAEFCNHSVLCARLWVDGRSLPLRQISGTPAAQSVSSDARTSGWAAGPGMTYSGRLEEVAVYDHALGLTRIRAHYRVAAEQPRSLVVPPRPPAQLVLADAVQARDPALGVLERSVAAAGSPASSSAALKAIGTTAPTQIGSASATASVGTVVVDSKRTGAGALVAYIRGSIGFQWVAVKQPRRRPAFAPLRSYAAAVLLDGPAGYWPLNDVDSLARDYSGGKGFGTYTDGIWYGTGGALGRSNRFALFSGGASTIPVRIAGLPTQAGRLVAVELWLREAAVQPDEFVFGFPFYGLYELGSRLGFNTGNNGDLYGAPITRLAGHWHHVVAEFCNGSVRCSRLYVDGKQVRLRQLKGTPAAQNVTAHANISGWPSTSGLTYTGGIEQVAVYGHALTLAQIRTHYGFARLSP